jgi:hypothetical protein
VLDEGCCVVLDDIGALLEDDVLVSIPVDDSGSMGTSSPHATQSTSNGIKPSSRMDR